MHVAVFGAGALGSVYGVRLAKRTSTTVSFVVRPRRVTETTPIAIQSVWNGEQEQIDAPVRVAEVPADADVIFLTVGTEDMTALAGPLSTNTSAPIVVVTPIMPQEWARLRAAYGDRVFSAYPTISAYGRKSDGVFRYWTLPAPTLIDEPRLNAEHGSAIHELVTQLKAAGLRAGTKLGVHEMNPATTVGFIPIGMGVAVAGSGAALVADEQLCTLVSLSCSEGGRLAHRIGTPEPYAALFPIVASRWALRLFFSALPKEALYFFEEHFGRKIAEQHRVMIRQMIDLAAQKGLPHDALDELADRLDQCVAAS